MLKPKIITVFVLFLSLNFSAFGKANKVYVLQRPIHAHGCHGMEVNYGISYKMHGIAGGYVYHINELWHMKVGGSFSNKNMLTLCNTYHYNFFDQYESTFLNFLVGAQSSYKFDHIFWTNLTKRFNTGIQLGIELEKYITDYLVLILLAEAPISFLDKDSVFNYRFSAGFRINF